MKPCLITLVCVCAVLNEVATARLTSSSEAWRIYKRQYGKNYGPEEDAMRFANFLATTELVERHNANPEANYKMRLNKMADWSPEEYEQLNSINPNKIHELAMRVKGSTQMDARLRELLSKPAPAEIDWRKVPNRVTGVKDQKNCSSSWAFSTVGLLEGQEALHNVSKLVSLSAQELVDCSESNEGCFRGFMEDALNDIAGDLGGINSEEDYKYDADEDLCRMIKSKFVISVKGSQLLDLDDEDLLVQAVANYGPVAVAFMATENFKSYSSGVFTDNTCNNVEINHNMLAVGYGTDPKEGDYWIVKNSWGLDWGEKGYIRVKRGLDLCGIARAGTLAVF